MRVQRQAGNFARDMLHWLALILYVAGGAALLFACMGYLFALGYHGQSVGFVYGLAVYALKAALLLLAAGVGLHVAAEAGRRAPGR